MDRKMVVGAMATLTVMLVAGAGYLLYDNAKDNDVVQTISNFDECAAAGHPVMESYPRQCAVPGNGTFTEVIENQQYEYTSEGGVKILLDDFASGKSLGSPVTITGEVPGSWSFEAVFPVVLVDWDGKIIAEGQAMLSEDWMTQELVPFSVTLEFEKPTYKNTGALILQKDNPSDLPENDDAVEVPVLYE